jgi:hypothetical protein
MQFYTQQRQFYCGIDLHATCMFNCVLDDRGNKGHPIRRFKPVRVSHRAEHARFVKRHRVCYNNYAYPLLVTSYEIGP